MDQAGVTRDLLIQLEGHLDQPLLLDNVATKTGYSKWYLQRMFRDVTGHTTGACTHARRLSKPAVMPRLTAHPILDIALQCYFDSQQTFACTFKKQFSQTPALYRHSPKWSAFGIRPPVRLGGLTTPAREFITLEDTQLLGTTQSYSYPLEQISDFRREIRIQFWYDFPAQAPTIPSVLYGFNETHPSTEKDDKQEVFYTIALTPGQVSGYVPPTQPILLQGGKYVMSTYEGLGTGVQEFILMVYGTCILMLNLTRRKRQDVERCYPTEDVKAGDRPINLRCEFLTLIRRQRCSSSNTGASKREMSPAVSTTHSGASHKLSW